MAELQKRLEKLEAQIMPKTINDRVIFLIVTPSSGNGGICPAFLARGVQSGRCGDRTLTRERNETEAGFKSRVADVVRIPGGVVTVILY